MIGLSNPLVDFQRGFLSPTDPLIQLPSYYGPWEEIVSQLPSLLMAGRLQPLIKALPVLAVDKLTNEQEWQRAMALLSMMGAAYVWGGANPALRIPPGLAIPWWQVAERLDLPPILTYTSCSLYNWRRLDLTRPIALDNMDTLYHFIGGVDEKWFFLIHVTIELAGTPAIQALCAAQKAVQRGDVAGAVDQLALIPPALENMLAVLKRLHEQCDPYLFYHRIRPFLRGWPEPGVIYEGISERPLVFFGGSGAQSPLLQVIDAGLCVIHENETTKQYLKGIRRYMLRPHREFIERLENGPSIRQFVLMHKEAEPALETTFNRCIHTLDAFRKIHMELSVRYIRHQAPKPEPASMKGTGGTDFVPFLSQVRKETKVATAG